MTRFVPMLAAITPLQDALINNPVLIFALVLSIILLAPLLAERLRTPSLIILILAGTLVGPHGLGWLARDNTFELLGTVGLLYLMFLAGLEIDVGEFKRRKHHSILFGTLTFLIPQIGGALLARLLFDFSWPTAILLASMFASHTLVPYPILSRLGLGRHGAVSTTVGGTILTDTAALLVLAVVVESHTAELDAHFWVRSAVLLFLLVGGILVLLKRLGYLFFRKLGAEGHVEFIFVLAMCFLSAYAAELAGVEPIIGAFLAGLAFSPLVPEQSPLMVRIRFVGEVLFIPFFLISVGMLINLHGLGENPAGLWISLFMVLCVTLSKWLAAQASGRLLGYDADERKLIFGLSVNQAAATLAAVLVGFRVGLLDEAILNGTILMILVTCMIGPYVTDKVARRISLRTVRDARFDDNSRDRILIPIANPDVVPALLDIALLMRDAKRSDPLLPLHVVQDDGSADENLIRGERMLSNAVVQALSADAPVTPVTRVDFNIAGGILRATRELRANTLIMGWVPERRASLLFQTQGTTDHIIRNSVQLLVLCRLKAPLNTLGRLRCLIPPLLEKHPGFRSALSRVQRTARQMGATLHLSGLPASLQAARSLLPATATPKPILDSLSRWPTASPLPEGLRPSTDLFVMLSVRRGSIAWQPALERLAPQIARLQPSLSFLMILLNEQMPVLADYESLSESSTLADLTNGNVDNTRVRDLTAIAFSRAPERLLHAYFDDNATAIQRIASMLAQTSAPIELAPGIALLHAHCDDISHPVVLLGLNRKRWSCPALDHPIRALFVLLSVRNQPPENHLEMLYRIAKFVQKGHLDTLIPDESP